MSAQVSTEDLLSINYTNEDDIRAFQTALLEEEQPEAGPEPQDATSNSHLNSPRTRVRKVSALSDFAPIDVTVLRRRRTKGQRKRQDWLFHIIRWPLLIVNAGEWMFTWRGRRGLLRMQLRRARTYDEWKAAAETMDEFMGFDDWKKEDQDPYYDWALVHKVRRSLRSLQEKDDARGVLGVLETCIRANFAGTESARLYSQTHIGTKNCIEAFINEVESALGYIRRTPDLQQEEKRRFFRGCNRNLGSSALCLSGGASFGYYHVGVVKALLDANLLPRVIAGTSAGGLIAALTCTRSDEELRLLLDPRLADNLTACEEPFSIWFRRFLKTGARFDAVLWARKTTFFTRGSLTFREAYQLTGRVLNISVIPFDRHSPTKLLNYLTAPDCVIWSALIASAAVPGILNPVVLMQKEKSGRLVPWNWGTRFKDGSLRVDIPIQSLNLLFNVINPIVSQVNPHVHLWHFGPRGSAGKPVARRKGKGWRGGFILSAAEQWLKLELAKNFKFMRDLELLPTILGQDWSSVFLQRFDGAVTIWPKTRVLDWFRILSDPDPEELARMIRVGQTVTWPKLHMIENRSRLEREITRGRVALRQPQARGREPVVQSMDGPRPTKPSHNSAGNVTTRSASPLLPMALSIESDAETAFTQGSPRFFKREHRHQRPLIQTSETTAVPAVSSQISGLDPLTLRENHTRRTPKLVDRETTDQSSALPQGSGTATLERPSPTLRSRMPSPTDSPKTSLFSRLSRPSFSGLGSHFTTFRRSDVPSIHVQSAEDGWSSSDSGSEQQPLDASERLMWHSPVNLPQRVSNQDSSEDTGHADDGLRDDTVEDEDTRIQ